MPKRERDVDDDSAQGCTPANLVLYLDVLQLIAESIDCWKTFRNFALTCTDTAKVCRLTGVQERAKRRFARPRRELDENGVLISECYVLPNGTKHGLEVRTCQNGNIKGWRIVIPWVNNQKHGNVTAIDCKGNIRSRIPRVNDHKHGPGQCLDKMGRLKKEKQYRNDQLHGMVRKFRRDGRVRWCCDYVNGKKHGLERYWSKRGILKWQNSFCNGEETGESLEFHPDGSLAQMAVWIDGKLFGRVRVWDPGQAEWCMESFYYNNMLHGPRTIVDDDGSKTTHMFHLDSWVEEK